MTGEWSTRDELAALGVEVAFQHYRATLAASGVKHGKLPPAFTIPRPKPWEPPPDTQAPRPSQTNNGRRRAATVNEVVGVLAKGFRR